MVSPLHISIRQAVPEDVFFVSQCVLASVDLYDFRTDSIEKDIALEVCGRDDTLYSWRHARIAEIGGRPVGCLVSYDGAIYPEARKVTFGIFAAEGRPMDDSEPETGAGEFYLDSMAILPEYRGFGIGHELMKDALAIAGARGFKRASLIVECSKPGLRDYYAKLGFRADRELYAFGDKYLKMILFCAAV